MVFEIHEPILLLINQNQNVFIIMNSISNIQYILYTFMQQHFGQNSSVTLTVQTAIQQQPTSYSIYYGLALLIIVLLFALKFIPKKSKHRTTIALVGQRFAGKTQLFISLNQGKKVKTVPSIHNNKTSYKIGKKIYEMIDYIGDNISKQQVLSHLDSVFAIVHTVDGTDQKIISDTAMFMYRVLVNKQYLKNPCNYIIFLNKVDSPNYIGKAKFEQKLQNQIEHIKQSRISQGDIQAEDDYIKLSKERFKIPIQIVQGSAEGDVKQLQAVLQNF